MTRLRRAPLGLVLVSALLAALGFRAGPGYRAPQPAAGAGVAFPAMMADADAVAAVQILRTDYTATAADGPMYAEARVLAVLKGSLRRAGVLKFGETAWCGPDYREGDLRILFLRRVTSREYFAAASWATDCRPAGRVAVFFAPDALPLLSPSALRVFLEDMQAQAQRPPRLKVLVAQRSRSGVVLAIGLINTGRQTLWVNPMKLTAGYRAGETVHTRAIRPSTGQPTDWTGIRPRQGISGSLTIARNDLGGQERLALTVTHRALYFPYHSWAGSVTSGAVQVGE